MYACTFFGHRDSTVLYDVSAIRGLLTGLLKQWIEKESVDVFFVGNQGGFDRLVQSVLKDLKEEYPHISVAVVLAYMPQANNDTDFTTGLETLYPDGLESVPRRYAIVHRNRWMLRNVQRVIGFVTAPSGGAAQFLKMAQRQGKIVYNLADNIQNG